MSLVSYHPPPPLGSFVDLFWLFERAAPTHPRERLLPTATVELVMDLRDDTRGPLVCGPHSRPFEMATDEPASVVGIHFKPGGAFPFLGVPAGELQNAHVSLDNLWGRNADRLCDRLLEANTAAARFRVLEQSLLAKAGPLFARHPAVAFALQAFQAGPDAPTIAQVTDRIGLSPRRFIQVFTDQVGLTPKLYCRVRRFQKALRLIDQVEQLTWAGIAHASGYYDQAHLIGEFRTFSGLTPSAYLQVRTDHINHVTLAG